MVRGAVPADDVRGAGAGGALGWPAGRAVWVGLSVLSLAGVALWGAAWLRKARGDARMETADRPVDPEATGGTHPLEGVAPPKRWVPLLLLAAWLSAGPVATTLEFGQLGLVVLALVLFAVGKPGAGIGSRPPAWAAGAALALAGCVKPQLAGVFALGFVALGRWRELGWMLGVGLAVAAVAVLRLEAAGGDWLDGLLGNLRRFAGTGFADPSPANRVAWQMVNLEPLWRRFFAGGAGVGVAAVLIAGVAGVAWRACRRRSDADAGFALWVMSVAAVVTLLIAYHRAYDAVLLAVPAVWAVWAAAGAARAPAHRPAAGPARGRVLLAAAAGAAQPPRVPRGPAPLERLAVLVGDAGDVPPAGGAARRAGGAPGGARGRPAVRRRGPVEARTYASSGVQKVESGRRGRLRDRTDRDVTLATPPVSSRNSVTRVAARRPRLPAGSPRR